MRFWPSTGTAHSYAPIMIVTEQRNLSMEHARRAGCGSLEARFGATQPIAGG